MPTHGPVAASVESLEQLVGRVRESGVTVELRRDGEGALPPLVDRAAYRVVQLMSAVLLGYQLSTCVLRPADFAALKVGAERDGYAAALPPESFRYPSDRMRAEPMPAGSTCEFYRSNINLLEQVDVYRLCWSDGRLVAKDVLPGVPGAV
ncbi:hypothetical protein ACFZCY_14515 [Streptomyces sp. NPDC007983]|uniref:hypothetical protein n=1 Tax=Streptomyces sp. NPDC007983 TaxID=3364800 RepID=UPI0036ED7D76